MALSDTKHTEPAKRKKAGLMPVLDIYILREFMIPMSVLILAFILLFLFADVYNDLSDFLGTDPPTSARTIAYYFLLKQPGNLRFILPITMLLACMYTMARLGKNMEVTAMRASGISLLRCGGSIYCVALIVTGINFYFNEKLVPYTERKAYIVRKSAGNELYQQQAMSMLQYRSPDQLRTWLFKSFNADSEQEDVILKKYSSLDTQKRVLEWDIKAKKSHYDTERGWQFEQATITPYFFKGGLFPGKPIKLAVLNADSVLTDDNTPAETFDKIIESFNLITETPADIINAVKPPEDLPSWVIWDLLAKTKNMAPNCRIIYETILYYRLSFPWACLIAVFLGIPLATKNERSGVVLSIIVAVAVIVIYQLLSNVCIIFGKTGWLPPIIAGTAPTLVFITYGFYTIIKRH